METFRSLSRQLLLALVLTSLASGVAVAREAVPFKATIAIHELISTGISPCYLTGDISGTGTVSSVGKVTLVSRDCINPMSMTEFSFSSDQVILTAANGDQIYATYSGMLTTEGMVGVVTGGYHIVGGTGRFSQATGAGTVQGIQDMSTGKGQIQLNGTISR